MNWLAHIFLSEENIDFKIGNYLADPLKGRAWENASEDLINGMHIHKIIDSYTDSHDKFIKSKQRLGNKGLLKAIVIDLTYDYLLTKNWDKYCLVPIDKFLQDFYTQANVELPFLPNNAHDSLKILIDNDILNKYQNLEHLKMAFKRVDKRLSPRLFSRDQTISYFDNVSEHIEEIESDFLIFFPQLCQKVHENLSHTKISHWKI